jgi:hypothetical protein
VAEIGSVREIGSVNLDDATAGIAKVAAIHMMPDGPVVTSAEEIEVVIEAVVDEEVI